MSSDVSIGLEIVAPDAVTKWRACLGPTNSAVAKQEAPNSIVILDFAEPWGKLSLKNGLLDRGSPGPGFRTPECSLLVVSDVVLRISMSPSGAPLLCSAGARSWVSLLYC